MDFGKKTTVFLTFIERDFCLTKKQVLLGVLLLLIATFGLRFGYSLMLDRQPSDARIYIQTVVNIKNNDPDWFEKSSYYSPLMPWIAGKVCGLGIEPETSLVMLNLIYGMIWVLVMFFLCRAVFDSDKIGLLGMAFAAFNPYSARMASQILREPLYILFFTLSIWCAVRYVKRPGNWLYPAMLGLLPLLGFCCRFEGLEIALFFPLALLVILMRDKMRSIKKCFVGLVIYLIIFGTGLSVILFYSSYGNNAVDRAGAYCRDHLSWGAE